MNIQVGKVLLSLAPIDVQAVVKDSFNAFRLDVIKRAAMQTAMEQTGGNQCKASDLLGINRKTFYRNYKWEWSDKCKGH